MSSSSLSVRRAPHSARSPRGGPARRGLPLGAPLLLMVAPLGLAPSLSVAAEWYMQPAGSLTVEGDTNLDLDPGERVRTEGNLVSLSSIFGVATATDDFQVRPRIEYRDYPNDTSDNRVEGYLDFNGTLRWSRSSATVYGSLEHRDEFNAELNNALYDNFNPISPTSPETGRTVVGGTRDSALVVPSYNFKISPVFGWSLSGVYQKVNYAPNNTYEWVDFDYYFGKASFTWNVTQRDELSFGAFGSKYEATRFDSHATGEGLAIDWSSDWTPLISTGVSLVDERLRLNEIQPAADETTDVTQPVVITPAVGINNTANSWGATVSATYHTQLSQFRLNGGRLITPTGAGALYVQEQLKFQYDRDVTYRLGVTGALIALKDHGISANVVGDDRSYVQSVVELKWGLTRTWYILGGYQYMWQKFQLDPTGAADNRIYIRVGYQALGRQQ
jgi:hypothetical protein